MTLHIEPLTYPLGGSQVWDYSLRPFELNHLERVYTKRDAFVLLGCDSPEYRDSPQRLASFVVFKRSEFSLRFVEEWLGWATDARALTDLPNTLGLPNSPDFLDHRHDQSLFSLLAKKHRVPAFRDPSQWGNDHRAAYPNSPYPQIIDHVRRQPARCRGDESCLNSAMSSRSLFNRDDRQQPANPD